MNAHPLSAPEPARRPSLVRRLLALGNYDFCPRANRYVYWLKQPIGWFLVVAMAGALIGAFIAPQGWLVSALVLLVMVVGVIWPWFAMRGLSAELAFNRRRAYEQESLVVTLTVANRWPWPVWGLLVEGGLGLQSVEEAPQAATALACVPGWSRSEFQFTFVPPRRGSYPLETPQLVTGFPFGIWSARRPIAAQSVLVWPCCIGLQSLPLLQGERPAAMGSLLDRPGHDGDIVSARHYREGDSLRRIHWIQTARRDTLIVCERQLASQCQVVVALDPGAFSASSDADGELLDWGLRVVASLCREFHGHACELACELNGERLQVATTVNAWHQLLDRLARFQPAERPELLRKPAQRGTSEQLQILVTTAAAWQSAQPMARLSTANRPRAVVLDLEESHGKETAVTTTPAPRPWMRLNLAGDGRHQLQHQWERQCHDDWFAS